MSNTIRSEEQEKRISFALNAWSLFVISCGVAAIGLAAVEQSKVQGNAWLSMVALALFVGPMTIIKIPGVKVTITLGDTATFACAALFGPSAAVLAAVAEGSITSFKITTNARKFAYNVATCAVAMMVAGLVTRNAFPLFGAGMGHQPLAEIVGSLGLFTVCYYVVTTALIASYITLSNREPLWKFWRDNLSWTSLQHAASGASALGVCFLVDRFGYYSFLVPVGLIMLVVLFYRTYFQKVESANKRTEHVEEQLRQAQKMEAVGRLAGGVAHDFNNLLTAIMGYSDFLLMKMEQNDPSRQHVEEIKKAGERAASLTRQLLAFSRKQVLQPKVLDLNSVVADINKMLGRLIGEDIELKTSTDLRLGRVKADPGQIEQVIMNLVVNARDAMPGGGRLVIETANVDFDEADTQLPAGSYVMLAVSDTGYGMDKEIQSRIFEPFFTTKEQGKGTGLGLSTVYGIVSQSGGEIRVESQPGCGTSVKVFLPRVDEPVEVAGDISTLDQQMPAAETILLVEDEDTVRRLVREVLTMNGYRVLEAADGKDALQKCSLHGGPIHLMVTDVVMPQMGGRELAERMAEIRPATKVLYVSGHTEDAIVHHGVSDQEMNFLQKPFAPAALISKVREVLEPEKHSSLTRMAAACGNSIRPVVGSKTAVFVDTDSDSFETIH